MLAFKPGDMDRLAEIYGKRTVELVHYRAFNDTTRKARTESSRQIRGTYNVPASQTRGTLSGISRNGLVLRRDLRYRGNRPGLHKFSTRAQKSIRVRVKKRGTKVVRGGFRIPKFGSLVWKRLTPAEASSSKYRNRKVKIKVLRTVSIPEMARSEADSKTLERLIEKTYEVRFDHHFKRQLRL